MKDIDARPKVFHEVMGIELLPSVPGEAHARMAVTHAVCQPFGFLSGGASLALAETLAGYGSLAFCEEGEVPLGVQVSANHVHAVPLGGVVQGVARIISRTRALHVWNVDITDEEGRLISTSRVTNCIKKRKSA